MLGLYIGEILFDTALKLGAILPLDKITLRQPGDLLAPFVFTVWMLELLFGCLVCWCLCWQALCGKLSPVIQLQVSDRAHMNID